MEDHQPQCLQRGQAEPSVFSQSAQTLFWIFLGGQFFASFGRGVLLWAFYVRPWVLSYFRSCLGTQGRSASRDGMGSGWPFYHTLVGRLFGLCFAFFPPQAEVASFGFHCVDSTGACQRDLRLEEPWSQPWQSGDAVLLLLAQPQQGRTLSREEGGVQERGSVRSPAWAGPEALCEGCGEATVALTLGQGEPAGRTPPATPWPTSNAAGARGDKDPWARSQPGLSEGRCPCKE